MTDPQQHPRLLILGWDGADWGYLDPLIARGDLPHLAGLLRRGCRADLASLQPRLSPLLWTSAVTGVTPDRHGVLNFVEPAPDGRGLRLAASTSRRCRALWNLLTLHGRRSHVVNWYATHPAEPIDGVVLSNQFFQASEPPAASIHPAAQHRHWLEALEASGGEARACRARILPDPAQPLEAEDKALISALGAAAERAERIHRLSMQLAVRGDWDCLLLFHEWIDVAGHHAMAYAPPLQEHISPRQQRLFGGVMEAVHREQDRMLGALLEAVPEEVNVILLSDHGFHHGSSRPRLSGVGLGDDRAEQEASWHRPLGILAMAGPGIRPGACTATASLLDITPTALALLNLPAADDMDGRVLRELLRDDPPAPVPSWEQASGNAGEHPAAARLDPFEAHEAVQQLIGLGYLAALPPGQADRVAFLRRETDFNLGMVLARHGKPAEAIPILEELLAQQPRNRRYLLLLVEALLAVGAAGSAAEHCRGFLDRQPLATDVRLCLALALRDLGEAADVGQQIALIRPETSQHHLTLADLLESLGEADLATTHYRAALGDGATALLAHLGLGRLALAKGETEQAAEHCLDAQAISLLNPEAHLLLALCLARLGMAEEASLSCRHALALFPHSQAALTLQEALAADAASRLSGTTAPEHRPSNPPERLLQPVLDWIHQQAPPLN